MYLGTMAEKFPDRPAIVIDDGEVVVTYANLDQRSNQMARALRRLGLEPGDTVAVMLGNCEQFFEVFWAAMRGGLYLTPINSHLTVPEVEYLVSDCDAKALVFDGLFFDVADAALSKARDAQAIVGSVHAIALSDATVPGALDYFELCQAEPPSPLADEVSGSPMFYSSGTTGRPKGIRRRLNSTPPASGHSRMNFVATRYDLAEGCRYLSPGPLYHAAPSLWSAAVHTVGGTAVVMRRFDPAQALSLIESQEITLSQWVPTMFQRMLRLPYDVRMGYDLTSHERAWHAAAPVSVEVKTKMIEWWGPILWEYYSASEGGGTIISPDEWIRRPGSVGRHYTGDQIHVLDPATKEELPPGREGAIYFQAQPGAAFEYHHDPEKTAAAHVDELFSAGDIGYVDPDGYLFLTDRQSDTIIAGGVNIYPREIEEAIGSHPDVLDVAVFGVPDPDLGERPHAVIQPVSTGSNPKDLENEIRSYLEDRLSRHKIPKSYEISAELPRDASGKLFKRRLRDAHWEGHDSRLV